MPAGVEATGSSLPDIGSSWNECRCDVHNPSLPLQYDPTTTFSDDSENVSRLTIEETDEDTLNTVESANITPARVPMAMSRWDVNLTTTGYCRLTRSYPAVF
eukprot:m.10635 g.10635  ORF g.10635 m.10635 type:complete len:102 (+) comp8421_c0_seq1:146-451(+)